MSRLKVIPQNVIFYLKKSFYYLLKRPRKLNSLYRVLATLKIKMRMYYNNAHNLCGPPFVIIIRTTNRCNLHCIQCGQWGKKGVFGESAGRAHELDKNEWMKFIESVSHFKPYIAFFGGEPLLREDTSELIEFASSKGLMTWISTNGTLLKGKAENLVKSGIDYVFVSLDGPQRINDKIRIGDNVYDNVVEGIRELVKAKKKLNSELPLILVAMTVIKENQHHITETSDIAKKLGVDQFSIRFPIFTTEQLAKVSSEKFKKEFNVTPKFWNGFIMDYSGMDIAAIIRQQKEVKKAWGGRYKPFPPEKGFNVAVHFLQPNTVHGGGLCILPWVRTQIMPNGDVVLCEDFPELVVGNILKGALLDIWNNGEYRHFRRYIREKGIFPACTRCCGLYEIPHFLNTKLQNKVIRTEELDEG
jgi:radical SAM protein with 4Fe4S-binding SPASM domain